MGESERVSTCKSCVSEEQEKETNYRNRERESNNLKLVYVVEPGQVNRVYSSVAKFRSSSETPDQLVPLYCDFADRPDARLCLDILGRETIISRAWL